MYRGLITRGSIKVMLSGAIAGTFFQPILQIIRKKDDCVLFSDGVDTITMYIVDIGLVEKFQSSAYCENSLVRVKEFHQCNGASVFPFDRTTTAASSSLTVGTLTAVEGEERFRAGGNNISSTGTISSSGGGGGGDDHKSNSRWILVSAESVGYYLLPTDKSFKHHHLSLSTPTSSYDSETMNPTATTTTTTSGRSSHIGGVSPAVCTSNSPGSATVTTAAAAGMAVLSGRISTVTSTSTVAAASPMKDYGYDSTTITNNNNNNNNIDTKDNTTTTTTTSSSSNNNSNDDDDEDFKDRNDAVSSSFYSDYKAFNPPTTVLASSTCSTHTPACLDTRANAIPTNTTTTCAATISNGPHYTAHGALSNADNLNSSNGRRSSSSGVDAPETLQEEALPVGTSSSSGRVQFICRKINALLYGQPLSLNLSTRMEPDMLQHGHTSSTSNKSANITNINHDNNRNNDNNNNNNNNDSSSSSGSSNPMQRSTITTTLGCSSSSSSSSSNNDEIVHTMNSEMCKYCDTERGALDSLTIEEYADLAVFTQQLWQHLERKKSQIVEARIAQLTQELERLNLQSTSPVQVIRAPSMPVPPPPPQAAAAAAPAASIPSKQPQLLPRGRQKYLNEGALLSTDPIAHTSVESAQPQSREAGVSIVHTVRASNNHSPENHQQQQQQQQPQHRALTVQNNMHNQVLSNPSLSVSGQRKLPVVRRRGSNATNTSTTTTTTTTENAALFASGSGRSNRSIAQEEPQLTPLARIDREHSTGVIMKTPDCQHDSIVQNQAAPEQQQSPTNRTSSASATTAAAAFTAGDGSVISAMSSGEGFYFHNAITSSSSSSSSSTTSSNNSSGDSMDGTNGTHQDVPLMDMPMDALQWTAVNSKRHRCE